MNIGLHISTRPMMILALDGKRERSLMLKKLIENWIVWYLSRIGDGAAKIYYKVRSDEGTERWVRSYLSSDPTRARRIWRSANIPGSRVAAIPKKRKEKDTEV